MSPPTSAEDPQVLDGKAIAILSYLSILCIIPLVIKKENPFVLFHGKQGLVIFVAEVIVFVFHIIFGLWLLKMGILVLGSISLVGMMAVLQGKYVKIPLVCIYAEKITL